jgi:hypothetical protein
VLPNLSSRVCPTAVFRKEIAAATSKSTTTTKLNEALIFLAMSLLVTAILKVLMARR